MMQYLALVLLLVQGGEVDRHRNLGKAYYEQGQYPLAIEELTAVLDAETATARDYVNAAMAYLQNGEHDRALAAFTTAGQMAPDMIAVDFGLGVLYKRQLRYPLALEAFSRVAARDPNDPATWFNIGAVSASMNRTEEAEEAFENVIAMGYARAQNFYVSALFRRANILARRGEQEAARELFDEFQSLRDEIPNVSLTPTALENGRHGRIEIPVDVDPPGVASPAAIELEQWDELRFSESVCEQEPSLALGDIDGDGDTDVFVASPCGGTALYRNDGDGALTDIAEEAGLADVVELSGAAFADFDNRGFPSLFVWGDRGSRLYRNHDAKFERVTSEPELFDGARMAVPFDADNDGRIDLFVSQPDGGLALFRNLDEGRFAEVWRERTVDARGAAAADFDANGFMDVLVVTASDEAMVLWNEGGTLEPVAVSLGSSGSARARVDVIDLDHDGWLDVVATDEAGAATLVNRDGRLEGFPALRGWASLVPLDLDGDGYTSFLARDTRGRHSLVSYRGGERFGSRPIALPDGVSGAIAAVDRNVVAASANGFVRVFERAQPASPAWLTIALEGTRTNLQALGAVVEVKAGRFYQKHPYPGHPVTLFVGERDRLDVVRITWANGVIQNEVDVATRQRLVIEEAEQQTSSCPFLYVWDGEAFQFLTDVVGRAPLGEILPGGGVVEPHPDDYVRIPPGAMTAQDGRFVFQLTEELRELAAIDAVELLAVDHPSDVDVYANERFSAPPFDPFRLYAVRERPGPDVPEEVRHADGRYAPVTRHRIAGFAEEHALVLEAPDDDGPLWLFLTGWVYWPSSSSMKALDAHGSMTPLAPVLQVQSSSGEWITVIENLGLPSGMHRTLVADLTGKFRSRDRRVRIVSNFAVYWDRAFFGVPADGSDIVTRRLEPIEADLHYRGFSVVSLDDRDEPEHYDYGQIQRSAPWNAVSGRYTRYGDVLPLIERADGAMVVMAPGDEMTLALEARPLPPLEQGRSRTFFLHVTGWAKDQDPNTVSSRTVSPLPGDPSPLMRQYQTREVPALVTPLAPPKRGPGPRARSR